MKNTISILKKSILIVLLFFINAVFSQQSYYNDVNLNLEGIALKNELATKITNTHTNELSYADAREALKIVDLVPGQGNNVYLVYGFAPELCPASSGNDNDHRRRDKSDFGGGATCEWNREHTYPQSLGTPELGDSGPGADAHMLRACDVQRNGQRGNLKFIDGSGNSGTVSSGWYPGDEWKGDMARIIMYMYLRYDSQCQPDNVGFGSAVTNDPDMIDLFLQWNAEDPVSEYEAYRNTYMENTSNIYGQGNRNPFIDNPYLATRIWGGLEAEDIWGIYIGVNELELASKYIIYPNPSKKEVIISNIADLSRITVFTLESKKLYTQTNFSSRKLDISSIPNGIYMLLLETTQGEKISKKLIINRDK